MLKLSGHNTTRMCGSERGDFAPALRWALNLSTNVFFAYFGIFRSRAMPPIHFVIGSDMKKFARDGAIAASRDQ